MPVTCYVSPVTPAASGADGDYQAQKALLSKLDEGELQLADVPAKTEDLFESGFAKLK